MIIEYLFSSRISLASLYNHLRDFQSENVFQIPVRLRGKTIQVTILLKKRQFQAKSVMKSASAGTHTEGNSFVLLRIWNVHVGVVHGVVYGTGPLDPHGL